MAFLEGQDDVRVFEAALGFVDEYLLDTSGDRNDPTSLESRSSTDPAVEPAPPGPHNASSRSVSRGAPSFAIDCLATSRMVPLQNMNKLRINGKNAGFNRSLLSHRVDPLGSRQRKPNPNRARDDVQFELVYLRGKVNELETKLRSLQLALPPVEEGALIPAHLSPLTRMPRVWEDMASRQRRHRDTAQQENARLKVMVERKQKMVTSLCEALQKRFIEQNAKYCHSIRVDATARCAIEVVDYHGDIGEFQDLFRRLETAYQEKDRVFAANGLAGGQIPTDMVQIREVDDKQIELFVSKLLPFGLRDVGEAAWDHFKGIEKHLGNGGLYGKSMKNLDQPFTIIEDFTKEVYSKNLRADVQAKQIVRRIVEADRDLILFVSSMTPTEIKHKAESGMIYHAQEYAVTKPLPDATTAGGELSLLQLCTRISIECEPGVKFDARHLRSAARFWIGNVAGNLRCYQERIENALVDQAVRRQAHNVRI